jgi:glycerol-1-phosphatase
MTVTQLTAVATSPVAEFDVALLDLDGVVYRGPTAVPHAVEALAQARAAGLGARYVTNNANRPPAEVAAHLVELGIPTGTDEIITAAQAAARLIASERPAGTRVLVIGGPGLREAVREVGLTVVESADDGPAVVVQGFAPSVGWRELSEAALAIQGGAEHLASNIDATLPQERGEMLGNGSLVAAVRNATGSNPRSTGKPDPEIFRQALASAGGGRAIVVGDRLDTDIEGARAASMTSMHVLTGVDGAAALLRCVAPRRPDLLALDLRGLLQPHPPVTPDGEGFRCGVAHARVVGDRLVLTDAQGTRDPLAGGTVTLDELRACCAAAWAAADAAGVPTVLLPDIPSPAVTDPGQAVAR